MKIIDLAAQALILVHFGTSRIEFGCTGVHVGISRTESSYSGVDLGAFSHLQNSIQMHRRLSGCSLAFQNLDLIAQGSIGVHLGTSRSKCGSTGVDGGALWYFKGSI